MRLMLRALAIAVLAGLNSAPVQAADFGMSGSAVPVDGTQCVFDNWGPDISLPWRSVWLGHFAGGRFMKTSQGTQLAWKEDHVCFPSEGSCRRWISAGRRAFHHPEGYWTCLPIR